MGPCTVVSVVWLLMYPRSQRPPARHPLMPRCLFVAPDICFVISEITKNMHSPWRFLVIARPREAEMKPPLDLRWVYPRGRHIACMHMGTQSRWMHTCTGGNSACLRFEASPARAACVIKSHSQRAVYPPRLRGSWHWQRMHTQRHTHKHNLHAWRNAQSAEQTHTFGYMKRHCSVSPLISVSLTFPPLTFWHWFMARHNNRKEGFALLYGLLHLRTVVWALPHSVFFLSSFLLACMIVGALTLKTHLNPEVLRGKKDEDQRNRGTGG